MRSLLSPLSLVLLLQGSAAHRSTRLVLLDVLIMIHTTEQSGRLTTDDGHQVFFAFLCNNIDNNVVPSFVLLLPKNS